MERGFSTSGLMVTKFCHALNADSIRAGTLLKSYQKIDGLIPEAEIIEVF
jgi:hypothetical protein